MDSSDASPAAEASSHRYPYWVMLDSYVRLNYPRACLDYPEDYFRETYADEMTSTGEHIDVSFRAVPPPGASRLYIRWTPRGRTKGESSAGRRGRRADPSYGVEPQVVAAHGNSILLQLTLDVDFYTTRSDFFVYTVHSIGPPSLWRLPSCDHTMTSDGLCSSGLEHMLTLEDIGLLCHGDKEFVVADLKILSKYGGDDFNVDDDTPVEAQLCVFRSYSPEDWKVTRPRIRHEKGQGEDLIWWRTDVVVPSGDSLCYVDYFRGILFGDVPSECPELRYIRLPVKVPIGNPNDRELGTRGCPQLFRSVCVTKGGIMEFVDVVCTTVWVSGSRSPASSTFTINLWKLRGDNMTWEKESALRDDELWSLQGYGDLPRVVPEFPLVSMEEPNIIYFVLSNDSYGNGDDVDTRIIIVDMLNKTLRSSFKYTKVDDFADDDSNMASRNLAANHAFIPCEFSKYLHVPETRKRKNLG